MVNRQEITLVKSYNEPCYITFITSYKGIGSIDDNNNNNSKRGGRVISLGNIEIYKVNGQDNVVYIRCGKFTLPLMSKTECLRIESRLFLLPAPLLNAAYIIDLCQSDINVDMFTAILNSTCNYTSRYKGDDSGGIVWVNEELSGYEKVPLPPEKSQLYHSKVRVYQRQGEDDEQVQNPALGSQSEFQRLHRRITSAADTRKSIETTRFFHAAPRRTKSASHYITSNMEKNQLMPIYTPHILSPAFSDCSSLDEVLHEFDTPPVVPAPLQGLGVDLNEQYYNIGKPQDQNEGILPKIMGIFEKITTTTINWKRQEPIISTYRENIQPLGAIQIGRRYMMDRSESRI